MLTLQHMNCILMLSPNIRCSATKSRVTELAIVRHTGGGGGGS